MHCHDDGNPYQMCISPRRITMARVLMEVLFFMVKLIVLAHRTKGRKYAPGGIGFVAAEESFGRAAQSQRIE
jgi:hypothetical protein